MKISYKAVLAVLLASTNLGIDDVCAFSHHKYQRISSSTIQSTRHQRPYDSTAGPLKASSVDEDVVTTSPSISRLAEEEDERYDKEAWTKGFQNVEKESCYALQLPEDFPKDISGTFFQNGHTKFVVSEDGTDFHIHPFDADGMITAVTFNNGQAWFRNRYVQTEGYVQEKKAGKVLYRGVFGTAKNKGKWWSNIFDLKQKNPANTHVLFQPNVSPTSSSSPSRPRLYALWEGGLPHEVDPVTLQTLGDGETDLGGTLDERYAAHYKVDPVTKTVCNFCINVTPPNTHTIQVFEHDLNTMELIYKKDHPGFPGIGVSHDCAITKDYFVFLQSPTKFDPLPFVLGRKGPAQCIESDDDAQTSSLILIPRAGRDDGARKDDVIVIKTPKMFTFHLSNAFQEQGDGPNGTKRDVLVADMILADSMFMAETGNYDYPTQPIWETFDFDQGLKYQLRRVKVDLSTKTFLSMESMTEGIASVEFPVVNPSVVSKSYKYSYVAATRTAIRNGVVQGLAKVDVQNGKVVDQWKPERYEFLGEVVFCPRQNNTGDSKTSSTSTEDDGYLMTFLFNGKDSTSELVVFDAKDVGKGPICRTRLDYMINFALHGIFVPGYTPDMSQEVISTFANL